MNLSESQDEITIKHIPVFKWITGVIQILIFLGFVGWLVYTLANRPVVFLEAFDNSWFELLLYIAFVVAMIWAAISESSIFQLSIFAPRIVVKVSHKTKSIDISYQRFYGTKTKRFTFSQIKKFKSRKLIKSCYTSYFLTLELVNKKSIKLKIPVGNKQEAIKLVKKLNKFTRSEVAAS